MSRYSLVVAALLVPSLAALTFGQSLRTVALTGQPTPDASGVKWDYPIYISLNSLGDVAFSSRITGTGVTDANSTGIWVEVSHLPQLIARKGNQAAGAPSGTT